MTEITVKCPICDEPYKIYPFLATDQSACPQCVEEKLREIDRRVAERVMRLELSPNELYWLKGWDKKIIFKVKDFKPTRDYNYVFMVIERMKELGYWCKIDIMHINTEVEFYQPRGNSFFKSDYELCVALCLAALEAMEAT